MLVSETINDLAHEKMAEIRELVGMVIRTIAKAKDNKPYSRQCVVSLGRTDATSTGASATGVAVIEGISAPTLRNHVWRKFK